MLLVPKCCPIGQTVCPKTKLCMETDVTFEPVFWDQNSNIHFKYENIGLIIGNPCQYGRYLLEPYLSEEDEFFLYPNGSLSVPNSDKDKVLDMSKYCLDIFEAGNKYIVSPLVCFPNEYNNNYSDDNENWDKVFSSFPMGLLICTFVLIITLVSYGVMNKLRETWSYDVISHFTSLICLFFTLSVVQYYSLNINEKYCYILVGVIQYFFASCFFSINALFYEAFNTSVEIKKQDKTRNNVSQLIKCFIICWIGPLIFVLVFQFVFSTFVFPADFLKHATVCRYCWVRGDTLSVFVFFYVTGLIVLSFISITYLMKYHESYILDTEGNNYTFSTPYNYNREYKILRLKECGTLIGCINLYWIVCFLTSMSGCNRWTLFLCDILISFYGIIIFYVFIIYDKKHRKIIDCKKNNAVLLVNQY